MQLVLQNKEKQDKLHLTKKSLQDVSEKSVFSDYLLSLLSQELLGVQAFEFFCLELPLIVPWEKNTFKRE